MKIITISGHAQHGKDTVASMMRNLIKANGYSVLIFHYADLLKDICTRYFYWDGKKDEAGRHLLQTIGTNIVRAKDPDFWVDHAIKLFKIFNGTWDYIIIPDTRFPNEIDKLRDAGFYVEHWKVYRPNFDNGLTPEQRQHPSEIALDDRLGYHLIINDGSIYDLEIQIHNRFDEILRQTKSKEE